MDMAMESQQGLTGFDKATDGDASHVRVQRSVIDHFTFERGEIERCFVRGGMKEKNGPVKIFTSGQSGKIVLNGGISSFLI
jgi:hypothetical protein